MEIDAKRDKLVVSITEERWRSTEFRPSHRVPSRRPGCAASPKPRISPRLLMRLTFVMPP